MISSFIRGWKIIYNWDKQDWFYMDKQESIEIERPCIRCGKMPTKEGHDACLGNIEGVRNACCGHGIEKKYIQQIQSNN